MLRRPGSSRPTKIVGQIKALVEQQMQLDNETTAMQLHAQVKVHRYNIFLRTILHCRMSLGWTFCGCAYYQLQQDANKVKHLEWARKHRDDTFEDVIWTDESSIQLKTHRRFCCRKIEERPRNKPR